MSSGRKFRLGDLQLRILRIIWQMGSATIGEVHSTLGPTRFAYTTIATMLRKMENKGLVAHRVENRRYIYYALVTESQVVRSATSDFVERLFQGSLAAAVCHLLENYEVTPEELEELERLIERRKQDIQNEEKSPQQEAEQLQQGDSC